MSEFLLVALVVPLGSQVLDALAQVVDLDVRGEEVSVDAVPSGPLVVELIAPLVPILLHLADRGLLSLEDLYHLLSKERPGRGYDRDPLQTAQPAHLGEQARHGVGQLADDLHVLDLGGIVVAHPDPKSLLAQSIERLDPGEIRLGYGLQLFRHADTFLPVSLASSASSCLQSCSRERSTFSIWVSRASSSAFRSRPRS